VASSSSSATIATVGSATAAKRVDEEPGGDNSHSPDFYPYQPLV